MRSGRLDDVLKGAVIGIPRLELVLERPEPDARLLADLLLLVAAAVVSYAILQPHAPLSCRADPLILVLDEVSDARFELGLLPQQGGAKLAGLADLLCFRAEEGLEGGEESRGGDGGEVGESRVGGVVGLGEATSGGGGVRVFVEKGAGRAGRRSGRGRPGEGKAWWWA